jgi:hypothetical protein
MPTNHTPPFPVSFNYRTSYVSVFFSILKIALFGCLGIVIYAYYVGCDPLLLQRVEAPDQVSPIAYGI